jgi:hypothetical protein
MKAKFYLILLLAVFAGFVVGLIGGIAIGYKRGIPFVSSREQWTIGIYEGDSPLHFPESQRRRNPVLKAEHVTDAPAKFVADPFLVSDDGMWYLFFEVYNLDTQQGDLAFATSKNTKKWKYEKIIIDEDFHLSYPYVFSWQDEYYLIPESFEDNSIRLYKADEFPDKWSFVTTLVDNQTLVDPSIVYYLDRWWLFATGMNNDVMLLFLADDLLGPWHEHPESPIVRNDLHRARSSGRVTIFEDKLYRFAMDVDPPVGTHQVWAYEITEITPTTYSEKLVGEDPIIRPSGTGWNAQAMHQLDPHQIGDGRWVASVDGFGKYLIYGLKY